MKSSRLFKSERNKYILVVMGVFVLSASIGAVLSFKSKPATIVNQSFRNKPKVENTLDPKLLDRLTYL